VGLGKILVVRALAFDEIGHGVQPQPVNSHIEPEMHHAQDRFKDGGIVEIEVGLVGIEAMPEIGLCNRIPCPVGAMRVYEDDPRARVFLVAVGPNVKVPFR